MPISNSANAAEYLYSVIGVQLTEIFFRPYTKKMWTLDLEDIAASVVMRLRVRYDDEDRYFPTDRFQLLPQDGYTQLFERILDHPRIRTTLSQPFAHSFARSYTHCFTACRSTNILIMLLALPYRSIRFHHFEQSGDYGTGDAPVTDFTDDGRWTGKAPGAAYPFIGSEAGRSRPLRVRSHAISRQRFRALLSREDCRWPLRQLYGSYKALADKISNLTFIGRCGLTNTSICIRSSISR